MESNCCSLTVFAPAPAVPAVFQPARVALPAVVQPAPDEVLALENAALALYSQIGQGEKTLSRTYWELGDTLIRLRPLYGHGNWEKELARLGIEQTKARKSMWFCEKHKTLDAAEKVESVSKAYADRPRKQKQNKKSRKVSVPVAGGETAGDETMPGVTGTGTEVAISTQQEDVTEDEYAAFLSFIDACGDLDRALFVVKSCSSTMEEVAAHE